MFPFPQRLWQSFLPRTVMIGALSSLLSLAGCFFAPSMGQIPECPENSSGSEKTLVDLALPQASANLPLLQESWVAYRQRFIQADGRVIDRETGDRTTSEGQAYAMLRAVLINDRDTFRRTLTWAESNLVRKDSSDKRIDQLWAWKWGNSGQGWKILDQNFASDADLDAVTALILAARRWNCPAYLPFARAKLKDIWNHSTAQVGDRRYFLPGPMPAFWNQPDRLILNPSYLAPYAFRLFAQVDPDHNWISLVDSSYEVLQAASTLSKVGLPSDWIMLDPQTKKFAAVSFDPLQSVYSFNAYRVWWRVALDANWFQEPRAKAYLSQHTAHLKQLWQQQQKIPARLDLEGKPLVNYEATSQYAMLYTAFQLTDAAIAKQIYQRKLMVQYRNGFWDNNSAYYSQNLAWFALLPSTPPTQLIEVVGGR
ncbi:glycosyl hydrolase [Kovacikia minuta CCNUW1]|uniref:glycosyl hydrolase family 8 n=1 Tax=Kovacikia minuta TaxID=2931930 RepID=UPI001CCB1A73|nr:glycosyl hydrolase family 8 [Kovacikia minuta]UBF24696.1 glycosyl hydrolase [Kovacikia minuta CCNUW1]